jgi:hypothetical protein
MSDPLPVRATYFAAPRSYQIDGDNLVIATVAKAGATAPPPESIPLRNIAEIRLSHYPARYHFNRFRCRFKTRAGAAHTISNTYWQGPVTEKDFSARYRAFVADLCRGVAAANPGARFLRGRTRAALMVENGVLLLLVAVLIGVWIWLRPSLRWFQILNLALIILYAPFAISSWRRNRAGVFDPQNVPEEILPQSKSTTIPP